MKPWFYELISFDKLLLSFHVRLIRVKVLGVILSYGTIRYDETCGYLTSARKTSLPKIIWEEGRVAAKVSPHWLEWRAPNSPPEVLLSVDRSPNLTTCLIRGPIRLMTPNGIRIRSAVFPQCTGHTDARTDARTDRQIVDLKVWSLWAAALGEWRGLKTDK